MTDAEYKKHRQRIRNLSEKWLPRLGLSWWEIDTEYVRGPLPSSDPRDGWSTVAKASVRWQYLRATLSFSLPEVFGLSDEDLERVFVHECCHVLVAEMRMWGNEKMEEEKQDEAIRHEERVVTTLTNAFLWTARACEKGKRSAKVPRRKAKKRVSGKPRSRVRNAE